MNKNQATLTLKVFNNALGENNPELHDHWETHNIISTSTFIDDYLIRANMHAAEAGIMSVSVQSKAADWKVVGRIDAAPDLALKLTRMVIAETGQQGEVAA